MEGSRQLRSDEEGTLELWNQRKKRRRFRLAAKTNLARPRKQDKQPGFSRRPGWLRLLRSTTLAGLSYYSSDLQIGQLYSSVRLRTSAGASQSSFCRRTVRPQLTRLVQPELAESESLAELRCFWPPENYPSSQRCTVSSSFRSDPQREKSTYSYIPYQSGGHGSMNLFRIS